MSENLYPDCQKCSHYVPDTEADGYYCSAPLDEDDVARLMTSQKNSCPYFDFYDEYKIVRKQN